MASKRMTSRDFVRQARAYRRASGLGLLAWAKALNIPPANISRWENGGRPVHAQAVLLLMERVARECAGKEAK